MEEDTFTLVLAQGKEMTVSKLKLTRYLRQLLKYISFYDVIEQSEIVSFMLPVMKVFFDTTTPPSFVAVAPISAFNIFLNDYGDIINEEGREQFEKIRNESTMTIKEEGGGIGKNSVAIDNMIRRKLVDLQKRKWKSLSEEERDKYNKLGQQEMDRYNREVEELNGF